MGTNYYWLVDASAIEDIVVPDIMLPTGQHIVPEVPRIDEHSIHIGKRSCVKSDGVSMMRFTWAIDPWICLDTCYDLIDGGFAHNIVRDEYGRDFNAYDFMTLVNDSLEWRLNAIGTRFC